MMDQETVEHVFDKYEDPNGQVCNILFGVRFKIHIGTLYCRYCFVLHTNIMK